MELQLMLDVILVLVSSMFGSLLVLMYKFDKLQKAVDKLGGIEVELGRHPIIASGSPPTQQSLND